MPGRLQFSFFAGAWRLMIPAKRRRFRPHLLFGAPQQNNSPPSRAHSPTPGCQRAFERHDRQGLALSKASNLAAVLLFPGREKRVLGHLGAWSFSLQARKLAFSCFRLREAPGSGTPARPQRDFSPPPPVELRAPPNSFFIVARGAAPQSISSSSSFTHSTLNLAVYV